MTSCRNLTTGRYYLCVINLANKLNEPMEISDNGKSTNIAFDHSTTVGRKEPSEQPQICTTPFRRMLLGLSKPMKDYAPLIQAIASLIWPLVVAGIVLYYRKEIKELLGRIKRGKFLGQEIELEGPLNRLQKSAEAAAPEIPSRSAVTTGDDVGYSAKLIPLGSGDSVDEVLETARAFPYVGLMMLSDLIDKELREIVYSQGEVDRPLPYTVANVQRVLREREVLPPHLLRALRDFQVVRNAILHVPQSVDPDAVIQTVYSGIKILEALQRTPRGVYVVHKPGVKLFSDAECANERQDVSGVILEMGSTEPKTYHIYPTTRLNYREREHVAWEWSTAKRWGLTWYRDPDTSEIKVAFSDSVEFVGRPLFAVQ